MTDPRCIEVTVNCSRGGKVAIEEYGKHTSDYHISVTRKFAVPPDWTEEQLIGFELEQYIKLDQEIDPIDQEEYEKRFAQRDWN